MPQLFDQQSPPPGAAAQGPATAPDAGQAGPPPQAPAGPQSTAAAVGPLIAPTDMASLRPTGRMPGQPEFNEEEVTPDEQANYDQFVTKALDFMGKNTTKMVASMNNNQKPIHENVGELAVKIGQGVYDMAKSSKVDISMEILQAAGAEIIEHLMELGDSSGIFEFEEDSTQYEEVQSMALLHAQKVVGERLINSPQYDGAMQEQAQNFYAQQVAGEVQRGEAPENFHENLGNQVAGGVRKAIQGG